jgi:monofunctional biosynthetic peptidoglycan transglycosylase
MTRNLAPVFDFRDAGDVRDWRIINDTVMGGVSTSRMEVTDEGAVFTGEVSLDQGGGFVSMRSPEGTYDLSGGTGLRLNVRGAAKRYKLTAYTEPGGRISYRAPFTPPSASEWETVDVAYADLTPYRRGRHVPDAPPFAPSQVRALGVLLGDEQAGPFRLEIRWIACCEL